MARSEITLLCATLVWSLPALAEPAGPVVHGTLVTQGVTDRPVAPHGWTQEKVYLSPLDSTAVNPGRLGVGGETVRDPAGSFALGQEASFPGLAAGRYALFTLSYDGMPAFSCKNDLDIPAGGALPESTLLTTPAHYSVMFNKGAEEWGKTPWVGGNDFYQTFVATSRHITRIATKLADKSGDHQTLTLNYAVYETNDGPPSTWKCISPVRSRFLSKGTDPIIHIFHVAYRSSEVELKPGQTYAVRFWRDPKSESERFALVARPDRGDGYRGGHLYKGDEPLKDWDAYAYISGGEPGTIVNHTLVGDPDQKRLIGSARRFGQTFQASGTGLAAADVIYTTGVTHPPALPITFRLYDRVDGAPISPIRACYGLPLVFQARAAAAWLPNEARLVPGRMYYLEWTCPSEINTWAMNEDVPGEAYRGGVAVPGSDLAMSIVEYEAASPTTLPAAPAGR